VTGWEKEGSGGRKNWGGEEDLKISPFHFQEEKGRKTKVAVEGRRETLYAKKV